MQSRGRAVLRLLVRGAGTCAGRLKLSARMRIARSRVRTKTLGTAVFSISAGRSAVITVTLNAAGRALFSRSHGRLNASLLIVRLSPGPVQAQAASVRLVRARPRKASPRSK